MEYGPEIPVVNGQRPKGIQDDDMVMDIDPGALTHQMTNPAKSWRWDTIKAIRLPKDHPYYQKKDEIAEWAIDRANALRDAESSDSMRNAFARYIMQHEEAPVDPLVLEAERLAQEYADEFNQIIIIHEVLKRGIELGKQEFNQTNRS